MLLFPRDHHERGNPLVEPEVLPRGRGHRIAPPLMRQLMRDDPCGGGIILLTLQMAFADEREAHRFLRRRAGHEQLSISAFRNGHARLMREEFEHLGRLLEEPFQSGALARCIEVSQIAIAGFLRFCVERPNRKSEQIRRGRLIAAPAMDDRSIIGRKLGAMFADAQRSRALGHVKVDQEIGFVAGAVLQANHPVAGEIARIDAGGCGGDAARGLACKFKRQSDLLASLGLLRQAERQSLLARCKINRLAVRQRARDVERIGREDQRCKRGRSDLQPDLLMP